MATLNPVFFDVQPIEQLAARRLHGSKGSTTYALGQWHPDKTIRQSLKAVQNHGNRCACFFYPDPGPRHDIAIMTSWNVIAQVLVRAVGMISSDIKWYSARSGDRTDHREINRRCLRKNAGLFETVLH